MIPHRLHDWPFLDKKIFLSLTVGTRRIGFIFGSLQNEEGKRGKELVAAEVVSSTQVVSYRQKRSSSWSHWDSLFISFQYYCFTELFKVSFLKGAKSYCLMISEACILPPNPLPSPNPPLKYNKQSPSSSSAESSGAGNLMHLRASSEIEFLFINSSLKMNRHLVHE